MDLKLIIRLNLVSRLKIVELYHHSSIHLHSVALKHRKGLSYFIVCVKRFEGTILSDTAIDHYVMIIGSLYSIFSTTWNQNRHIGNLCHHISHLFHNVAHSIL
jgi:hypothetical protein